MGIEGGAVTTFRVPGQAAGRPAAVDGGLLDVPSRIESRRVHSIIGPYHLEKYNNTEQTKHR